MRELQLAVQALEGVCRVFGPPDYTYLELTWRTEDPRGSWYPVPGSVGVRLRPPT